MICVYDKKTKKGEFDNIGLGVLDECIAAEITEELNGEYSLYLEYPARSKKANYLVEFNIIKANGQLFRIYKIEREGEKTGKIKVWARHIFYDLAFCFIEYINYQNIKAKDLIELVITSDIKNSFEFTIPNTNIETFEAQNINIVELVFKILEVYKLELKRDNFSIELVQRLGEETGVLIKYAKNIKGIKAIVDTSDFATKIYPIGYDNITLPEKYIESNIDILPYSIVKKVEFPQCKNVNTLRIAAQDYLDKITNLFMNVSVDFLELAQTQEYKDYSKLTKTSIGDIVDIRHEILNIQSKLRVIKKKEDLLNPINTKIELGDFLNEYINENKIINRAISEFKKERAKGYFGATNNQIIEVKNDGEYTLLSLLITTLYSSSDMAADLTIHIEGELTGVEASEIKIILIVDDLELKSFYATVNNVDCINIKYLITNLEAGEHEIKLKAQMLGNSIFTIPEERCYMYIRVGQQLRPLVKVVEVVGGGSETDLETRYIKYSQSTIQLELLDMFNIQYYY